MRENWKQSLYTAIREYPENVDERQMAEDLILHFPVRLQEELHRTWLERTIFERACAWNLLDEILRRDFSLGLEDLDIVRSEYGKPYSRAYPDLRFNISHCPAACACAVRYGEKVGIDIERPFVWKENLARKICHPKEWEYLQKSSLSLDQKERILRYIWSMKESIVKMDGKGLGFGIERIDLIPVLHELEHNKAFGSGSFLFTGWINPIGQIGIELREYEKYVMAVCSAVQMD